MRSALRSICAAIFCVVVLLGGCAVPPQATLEGPNGIAPWRGRLAVKVESDPSRSFSAGFELKGNGVAGELILYTPLGSTVAALSWSSGSALMRANGEVRHFESLNGLIKQAVGIEIPVAALFAWLAGDHMAVSGWDADLSQYDQGRITARRMAPAPLAELRLILEK